MGLIALSPAFRVLDTDDLRRRLYRTGINRVLAYISRTQHARSWQKLTRDRYKSDSRLHFAHSTRTISTEHYPGPKQIAFSPTFRAFDTRDLHRKMPVTGNNRIFAYISRTRHTRSLQKIIPDRNKSRPHRHFAHARYPQKGYP